MIRTRLLSLAVVALLGAGLVTGCGGDDEGGDEDPQQVLDETFSNECFTAEKAVRWARSPSP